jgi:hypothetical protein
MPWEEPSVAGMESGAGRAGSFGWFIELSVGFDVVDEVEVEVAAGIAPSEAGVPSVTAGWGSAAATLAE